MAENGNNDLSQSVNEATEGISKEQAEEILGWSKLTNNIYIWDYVTDYFNYQLPFPCFQSLQGNMQYLAECDVRAIFSLGAYNERGSSDTMKNYLIAKLLWNPGCDYIGLMNKFISLYYGNAGTYIRQYYQEMEKRLSGRLWVYDFAFTHSTDYLSREAIAVYDDLFAKAFTAIKGDEVLEKRLRYDKISLLYAKIQLKYDKENYNKDCAELVAYCDEFNIKTFNEIGTITVDKYRD